MDKRPKDSVARHFELIGIRPNETHAELLIVGKCEESIRDLLQSNSPGSCHGYGHYEMIEPGQPQPQPIDVLETSDTINDSFGKASFTEFAHQWVRVYDRKHMSSEKFKSLYGEPPESSSVPTIGGGEVTV